MADEGLDKLPFFIRGVRTGFLADVEDCSSFFRGILRLDDCDFRKQYAKVVDLARQIDNCPDHEYQGLWDTWIRMCGELQDLQLWIGNSSTPVEEFTIESDWKIEWRNRDPDFVRI